MSLWRKREQRGIPYLGTSRPQVQVQHAGFADLDGGQIDTAMQAVAVRSSVDLIASITSELPVHVYRGRGASRTELPMPPWLEDPAGDGNGLEDWGYQVLVSWLLRGNLFGEELARGRGHRTQMRLFHPDCVSGWLENGELVWSVLGERVRSGFVHKRVNPMPGNMLGLSPISYHASTVGLSLTGQQFGLQWFRDGGHPTSILTSTERTVDEPLAKKVKERFLASLRGTREPVVLDKGWEHKAIQINPEESQFLETQGYSAAECARMFGPGLAEILGYETGGSMTYSNLQDRDLHVLKYALNKWFRRYERLLSEFLPRPQYVRIDRDALLETNTLQRYQAHASALKNRWKTVNEVREDEDEPPVPWGNKPNAGASGVQVTPVGGDDEEGNEA